MLFVVFFAGFWILYCLLGFIFALKLEFVVLTSSSESQSRIQLWRVIFDFECSVFHWMGATLQLWFCSFSIRLFYSHYQSWVFEAPITKTSTHSSEFNQWTAPNFVQIFVTQRTFDPRIFKVSFSEVVQSSTFNLLIDR